MCSGECGCTGDCGPGVVRKYIPRDSAGGVSAPPSPGSPPAVMDRYTEVWKVWKMGSLFLFAIFVGAMIDSARSIRRIAR